MDHLNLGRPIGGVDQGEHGAGTGLSGGHGVASAANTQSGKYAEEERSGFNAGLGGEHASGGIPHGHTGSAHPIADKFTSGSHTSGDKLDNKLDNYTGHAGSGSHGSAVGAGAAGLGAGALGAGAASGLSGEQPVSGEYAGHGTKDALTGESHATRTGAGVGPLGENTAGGVGAGTDAGAAGLATAKSGVDTTGVDVDSSKYGTGVGASGGAGGHYDESSSRSGAGLAAGAAGAGALGGAGAAAAGHHGESTSDSASGLSGGSTGKTGRFGTEEKDFERGAPVSDPKALDSGGPHSLVFQESTGKYVHRHELEGAGSATRH